MRYHLEPIKTDSEACYCLVGEDEQGIATVAGFRVVDIPQPAKLCGREARVNCPICGTDRLADNPFPCPACGWKPTRAPELPKRRTFWERFWGNCQS